jgi:hypothetical protein
VTIGQKLRGLKGILALTLFPPPKPIKKSN